MKKNKYVGLVLAILAIGLIAAGSVSVIGIGKTVSTVTSVYGQGEVDTVKWNREKGVVGAAFSVTSSDTVNIQSIIVKRVVGGAVVGNAVVVADTIAGAAVSGTVPVSAESSSTAKSFVHSFTLTPYADSYWFIVKYATGVTYKNGSGANDSTFIATYKIHKQYSAE